MIKYLVMDVDGTLTDGKIYMGQDGELFKAFNIKDGCGIKEILPKYSVTPIVITARKSQILEERCRELGIKEIYQGYRNKLEVLLKILASKGDNLSAVAYVGDDLPDIDCMMEVKQAGGKVLCPSDASPEVLSFADYISKFKGGEGAVRDCIYYLLSGKKVEAADDKVQRVIEKIVREDFSKKAAGEYKFDDGTEYSVIEYWTGEEKTRKILWQSNYAVLQYIIKGHEIIKIYQNQDVAGRMFGPSQKNVNQNLSGVQSLQFLNPKNVVVIYNNQPYKDGIQIERRERIKKVICRIPF